MLNRQPNTSRRHLLALSAASLGFGATGGYLIGANPFADEQPVCDPRERIIDPDDWPAPRYEPAGTARAPARNAPTGELEEIWHAEIDAFVETIGQPVISTGRVAVAVAHPNRERILTLDLATGRRIWDERIPEVRPDVGDLTAIGGDVFYQVKTEEIGRGVMALSLRDGTRRWSAPDDLNPRSGPVVTEDGHVWFAERHGSDDESSVGALSADTGVECSTWRIDGSGGGSLVFDAEHIYHGTSTGAVALDRENGDERWRTKAPRFPQLVANGRLYATRSFGWLSAHDIDSGSTEWTVESEHYLDGEADPDDPHVMIDEDGTTYARPDYRDLALADDVLISRERVWSDHADRITAFDPEDGDIIWQLEPEDEWPAPDNRFWYTGPVVAGDSAFVCENRRAGDSSLQRIAVTSGEIIDTIELDESAMDGPAVGRGAVVVPTREGITCYADDSW